MSKKNLKQLLMFSFIMFTLIFLATTNNIKAFEKSSKPSVISIYPSGNYVPSDTSGVTILFNLPMATSKTHGTVEISDGKNRIYLNSPLDWINNQTVFISFAPEIYLVAGKTYTIYISNFSSNDWISIDPINSSFTVGQKTDSTKPLVASVAPTGTDVSKNVKNISVTFDEPMSKETIGTINIPNANLSSVQTWTSDMRTVTIDFLTTLSAGTTYNISISDFKDVAGNIMDTDDSYKFSVKEDIKPLIKFFEPNGNDVPEDTESIVITFDTPMDTLTQGVININGTNLTGLQSWIDNQTVTVNFDSPLVADNIYTVNISGFKNADDIFMDNVLEGVYDFRTIISTNPVVASFFPRGDNVSKLTNGVTITFDETMDTLYKGNVFLNSEKLVGDQNWTNNKTLNILFNEPLKANTNYDISISDFEDKSSNIMIPVDYNFKTAIDIQPKIISFSPNGNNVVKDTSGVSITFDTPMNTLSEGVVEINDVPLTGDRTWINNTLTIPFNEPLHEGYYKVKISGFESKSNVVMLVDDRNFIVPDLEKPLVVIFHPTGIEVPTNIDKITIIFDEPMDSLTKGTVKIDGVNLDTNQIWANGNKTVRIDIKKPLVAGTLYPVTEISGFKDKAGNQINSILAGVYYFTTSSNIQTNESLIINNPKSDEIADVILLDSNKNSLEKHKLYIDMLNNNMIKLLSSNKNADTWLINFDTLKSFEQKNKGGTLNLNTPGVSYYMPFNISECINGLSDYIQKNQLQYKDLTIALSTREVTTFETIKDAYQTIYHKGKIVSNIYDINIKIFDKNNKPLPIDTNNFKNLISFELETKEKGNALVTYNESSKRFEFVPANNFEDYKAYGKTKTHSIYMAVLNDVDFNDVQSGNWYTDYIKTSANKALVIGSGRNQFKPNQFVTRAEFVHMMVQALQLSKVFINTTEYKDVIKGEWYYDSIMKAKTAGILELFDDINFNPNDAIKRKDMALIIATILKNEQNYKSKNININIDEIFDDTNILSAKDRSAIELIIELDIMQGMGNKKFAPNEISTRAQASRVEINLLKVLERI